LLLCCVGGVVGFGALVVAGERAFPAEARSAVTDFLDGLARRDYPAAYDQVCADRQRQQSLVEFTTQERSLERGPGFHGPGRGDRWQPVPGAATVADQRRARVPKISGHQ